MSLTSPSAPSFSFSLLPFPFLFLSTSPQPGHWTIAAPAAYVGFLHHPTSKEPSMKHAYLRSPPSLPPIRDSRCLRPAGNPGEQALPNRSNRRRSRLASPVSSYIVRSWWRSPVVQYRGGDPRFRATKPAPGQKLDPTDPASSSATRRSSTAPRRAQGGGGGGALHHRHAATASPAARRRSRRRCSARTRRGQQPLVEAARHRHLPGVSRTRRARWPVGTRGWRRQRPAKA